MCKFGAIQIDFKTFLLHLHSLTHAVPILARGRSGYEEGALHD